MRNLKRALSLALASVMVLGLMIVGSSAASGSGFKDYDEVNYKEAADVLNAIGIFIGDENGNFNPDQTLTRAMAAKIVATMILGEDNAEKLPANDNIFKDIDKNTASWAGGYIAYCANNGFIAGDGTGNFNPNGELTGVAFGKVLLTALGYNAKIEGYIDTPSWAINVASAMVETEIDVDGVALNDPITREQAAQMALNVIKTPMVEYDSSVNVNVNGASITVGNSKAHYKTTDLAKEQRISDRYLSNTGGNNGRPIYTVEFGEKYMPNLVLDDDAVNIWGEPCNEWAFKTVDIGSYPDTTLLAKEYPDDVTSKTLYGEIGYSRLTHYDFYVYIDGALVTKQIVDEDGNLKTGSYAHTFNNSSLGRQDILDNDSDTLGYTGKGVLTEIFVDDDTEEISVVVINTYLGIANGDYNSSTKKLPATVYVTRNGNQKSVRLYSDDFANIVDVKEHTAFKVKMAVAKSLDHSDTAAAYNQYDIQSVELAEVVSGTTITGYTTGDKTTDIYNSAFKSFDADKQYDASAKTFYDPDLLDTYNKDHDKLKNATYDLYLDNYGNVLGLKQVEKVDNYIFVVGYEPSSTVLAQPVDKALIITIDGTMKTVNMKSSDRMVFNDSTDSWEKADRLTRDPAVNTWYTYTMEGDTYVLQNEVYNQGRDLVFDNDSSKNNPDISGTHAGLNTNNPFTDENKPAVRAVYGNDDSVYIAVKADKSVDGNGSIVEIQGVTTGIKNTSIVATDVKGMPSFIYDNTYRTTDGNETPYDTYFIYNDNGYVSYAVVIGENQGASSNMVFFRSPGTGRYYDAELDLYYVTYNVIKDGELTSVKVKDNVATGANPDKYQLFKAYFDKNDIITDLEGAGDWIEFYDNGPLYTDYNKGEGYTQTTCTANGNVINPVKLKLIGNTLYVDNENAEDSYVVIDSNCKVFVHLYNADSSNKYEEFDSVRAAINSLTTDPNYAYVARVTTIVNKTTGYAETLIITEMKKGNTELVGKGEGTPVTPPTGTLPESVQTLVDAAKDAIEAKDPSKLQKVLDDINEALKDNTLSKESKDALNYQKNAINSALTALSQKTYNVTLGGKFFNSKDNTVVWDSETHKVTNRVETEGAYGASATDCTYKGIKAGSKVHIVYTGGSLTAGDVGTYKINGVIVTIANGGSNYTVDFVMPNADVTLDAVPATTEKLNKVTLGANVKVEPDDPEEEFEQVGSDVYYTGDIKVTVPDGTTAFKVAATDAAKKSGTDTVSSGKVSDFNGYIYAGYKLTIPTGVKVTYGDQTVASNDYVDLNTTITIAKADTTPIDTAIIEKVVGEENVIGTSMKLSATTTISKAYKVTYTDENIENVKAEKGADTDIAVSSGNYVVDGATVKASSKKEGTKVIVLTGDNVISTSEISTSGTTVSSDLNLYVAAVVTKSGSSAKLYYIDAFGDSVEISDTTSYIKVGTTIKIDGTENVQIGGKQATDGDYEKHSTNKWQIKVGYASITIADNA